MRGHREVSHNLRGTLLARLRNSCNSFRITSLADPRHLTPTESHPYEKTGEGSTRSACPPVFRTFFQVPYPLSLVFSHSSKNDRGVGYSSLARAKRRAHSGTPHLQLRTYNFHGTIEGCP